MAKEGERGLSRAEEAFSALSDVPEAPRTGPWKLATALLLVMAIGLCVALAGRISRARREAESAADRIADLEVELDNVKMKLADSRWETAGVRELVAAHESLSEKRAEKIRALETDRARMRERIDEFQARDRARADSVDRARARIAAEDPAGARVALADAVSSTVPGLYAAVRDLELRQLAEGREQAGDLRVAASLWSVYSLICDPDRSGHAEGLRARVDRETLAKALRSEAEVALSRGDYEGSGAFVEALGRVEGIDTEGIRDAARANARLRDARRFRDAGELEAALALAREAAALGSPVAQTFGDEVAREVLAREHRERVERIRRVLGLGAAGFADAEAEELFLPETLVVQIEIARAAEAIRRARAALLRGDVDAALAAIPEGDRRRMLLGAAVEVFPEDPMRAVALAKRASEGGEPGPLAHLVRALALEGTDRAPDSHADWKAIRDLALEKAPLPSKGPGLDRETHSE